MFKKTLQTSLKISTLLFSLYKYLICFLLRKYALKIRISIAGICMQVLLN